jgi:hypothetical protein
MDRLLNWIEPSNAFFSSNSQRYRVGAALPRRSTSRRKKRLSYSGPSVAYRVLEERIEAKRCVE